MRVVGLPETMRSVSLLGSISGPTTLEGSGLPLGQSSRVGCCAVFWAGAVAAMARRIGANRRVGERIGGCYFLRHADGAGWSEDVDSVEPGLGDGGPGGDGELRGADAEAAAALGEDVALGGG